MIAAYSISVNLWYLLGIAGLAVLLSLIYKCRKSIGMIFLDNTEGCIMCLIISVFLFVMAMAFCTDIRRTNKDMGEWKSLYSGVRGLSDKESLTFIRGYLAEPREKNLSSEGFYRVINLMTDADTKIEVNLLLMPFVENGDEK